MHPSPDRFVALHPSRRFLYVINEIDDYEGRKSGSAAGRSSSSIASP
jgi:hypothetical protein